VNLDSLTVEDLELPGIGVWHQVGTTFL
jgi:hypothetical protein